MGMGEPRPPAATGGWDDGPSPGLSKADEDGSRIQKGPSRRALAVKCGEGGGEGVCLPTAGPGDATTLRAKGKSHLDKTRESYFVGFSTKTTKLSQSNNPLSK